jgi:hypothetical protein
LGCQSGGLRDAIEQCGVTGALRSGVMPVTADGVDRAHRRWCRRILAFWRRRGVRGTYGRAAKLLSIYLKGMVVVGPRANSAFARLAHPPIDRILLMALARDRTKFNADLRSIWRGTEWTSLDEKEYFELIGSFRAVGLDKPAFWQIERYWRP